MSAECFPDGTPIDSWFCDSSAPSLSSLGKQYVASDFGVLDDGKVHTAEFQALIDRVSSDGGGVVVIPSGTYFLGAVWLKAGVHLYIKKGGILKGSDDIADYPPCETRIEGEFCRYFPALINAENIDGLCIFGEGTIDGNGLRSWRSFWLRRDWNPDCTNKDEQRARLLFISNCKNVIVSGLTLQNSQFWTLHLYKCEKAKILSCKMISPAEPVKAPSTDAIDLDVCSDILIKKCFMSVNDDAVALKGGKGAWADTKSENGTNERIIIEDCEFGFCHGCLTVGSESVHDKNILVRRVKVSSGFNLLWLKMRPDTPQIYEFIALEDIHAKVNNFLTVRPWTQFFDSQGRADIPISRAEHISIRRCVCECDCAYNIEQNDGQYRLEDFSLEDVTLKAKNKGNEEFFRSVSNLT